MRTRTRGKKPIVEQRGLGESFFAKRRRIGGMVKFREKGAKSSPSLKWAAKKRSQGAGYNPASQWEEGEITKELPPKKGRAAIKIDDISWDTRKQESKVRSPHSKEPERKE